MLTEANAFRTDGLLRVTLIGQSPMPYDATIEGFYPGNIMHLTDPGSAQIFIREQIKPEFKNMYCTPLLGKTWFLNQIIRDSNHKSVDIFINGQFVRKIRIIEHTVLGMYNIIDL